jgi:transposase
MRDRDATASATTDDQPAAIIFAAIELSRVSWLVALRTPGQATISRHKLASGDLAALLALFERVRRREEARLGRPCSVVSCYEAGYDGFWLHRALTVADVINHVLDPSSLQVDRRGRPVKTDRIDAEGLLRAVMAHHRGERGACRVVRVPTPAQEDAKRTHRERKALIRERIRHVNRIKGLLATQGIYGYDPLRPDRCQRLAALSAWDGRPLPTGLRRALDRELERLELVLRQLAAVEAERDAAVKGSVASGLQPQLQLLTRLKGIGPEIATVLSAEVFYRDFRNRREVAAYAGLTPSPFISGGIRRDQGISKAGNPLARTAMVELAWIWVRYQPGSELAAWFRQRAGAAGGRVRRIAIVALARKLLVALWRYLEHGVVPTGAVLKA